MNWFETLKAADFGFYSDDNQAGTYLNSPFQLRQTPTMSRQESDKILPLGVPENFEIASFNKDMDAALKR